MARGGLAKMTVSFKGQKDTLEKTFGSAAIPVTMMTKKLWKLVKARKLMKKR